MREFFMDAGIGWYLFILVLMAGSIFFLTKVRKKLYGGPPKKKGLIK